jgi:hypothetical protein
MMMGLLSWQTQEKMSLTSPSVVPLQNPDKSLGFRLTRVPIVCHFSVTAEHGRNSGMPFEVTEPTRAGWTS